MVGRGAPFPTFFPSLSSRAAFYLWCLVAGPVPTPKTRTSGRVTKAKKRA